jgi:very-short-patch-repair endonuclease
MRQTYDQRREEYLLSKGIKVIRFSNDEVKNNIDEVIRRIHFECGVA